MRKMVEFFKNEECTDRLYELRLDDQFVTDIYGGRLENVVEVGKEVTKTIYAKNTDADQVLVRNIIAESKFMTFVVAKPNLKNGEVTPIHVTFSPTEEGLASVNAIEDEEQKKEEKRKLLRGEISVDIFRVTSV